MEGRWQLSCPNNCGTRLAWTGSITAQPPCKKCDPAAAAEHAKRLKPKQTIAAQETANATLSPAVEKILAQCDSILHRIEELPFEGEDFGSSVAEKVEGIRETIEDRGFVTEGQRHAINNMEDGVERWFR